MINVRHIQFYKTLKWAYQMIADSAMKALVDETKKMLWNIHDMFITPEEKIRFQEIMEL